MRVAAYQFEVSGDIDSNLEIIKNDPYGVVCICGDLGDYGLKNSKTNVYKATMQPDAQQAYIFKLFEPIKDKIVSAVHGNHEETYLFSLIESDCSTWVISSTMYNVQL